MKSLNSISKAFVFSIAIVGTFFSASALASPITLQVPNEKSELVTIELQAVPERIAVLNYTSLDILDKLGLGDRVVGMVKGKTTPEYLKKYADNPNIKHLGSMKDADMETLMEIEPDIIFSSDRTLRKYQDFSMIAPTVVGYVNYADGFFNGYKENLKRHAKIFGKQAEAAKIIEEYTARIEEMKKKADDKSAMLGLFTGGSLKVLGDKGRLALITNDIGFNNQATDVNVNHGNVSSYELFVKINPDYFFILDKDVAVGSNANSAKQLLDNELFQQTNAYKNNNIVFLEPGDAWYLTDGGIVAMDLMLDNMEAALKDK